MEGEKVEKRPTAEQAEPASLDRGTNLCVCRVTNPGEDRSEMAAVRAARLRGEGKESSEGSASQGLGVSPGRECWLCLCSLQGTGA